MRAQTTPVAPTRVAPDPTVFAPGGIGESVPPVKVDVLELADPGAPYGLRGIGEPPNISTPPAIVAALRHGKGATPDARPEQIVGMAEGPPRRRPQPGCAGYSALGTMRERREY